MTNDEKLKLVDEILAIDDSYIDDAEDTFIGFQPRDTAFVPLTHALNLEALKAILTEWKELKQWREDNCGHDWVHLREKRDGGPWEFYSQCSHCGKVVDRRRDMLFRKDPNMPENTIVLRGPDWLGPVDEDGKPVPQAFESGNLAIPAKNDR